MVLKNRVNSWSALFEFYSWLLVLTWSIIIASMLLLGLYQIRQVQREIVQKEARANFSKDQAIRLWATMHGGVYVPVTAKTPPNPYLSHVQERDLKTPSGIDLTLMNPAYMLRQAMDNYEIRYGIRGHITSLKHFRPETGPDECEKYVLKKFEKGVKEVFDYAEIDGKPYFRFMAPMIAKRDCLKCHGHQGYKVGDVRGGVSVSVPMAPYLANQRRQTISYSISFILLWSLGFMDASRIEQVIVYPIAKMDFEKGAAIIRISDITNEKMLQKQIVQTEKLSSLGFLVSGVAHEINNPNNFISFNIPILKEYLNKILPIIDDYAEKHENFELFGMTYPQFREDVLKLLDNIENESSRITTAVSNLRGISPYAPGKLAFISSHQ